MLIYKGGGGRENLNKLNLRLEIPQPGVRNILVKGDIFVYLVQFETDNK